MRFCEYCGNMLIPRKKKLYCKACDMEFELGDNGKDYKIIKKILHDEKDVSPVVVREGLKGEKISASDRKAFEDYFIGSESGNY